jgi:hypothetical protein
MIWGALLGGLIGAGISGFLTYLGLRRTRQASDAEAFGPAVLLLDRFQPDRVMFSISRDPKRPSGRTCLNRSRRLAGDHSSSGLVTLDGVSVTSPMPRRARSPAPTPLRGGRWRTCWRTETTPNG